MELLVPRGTFDARQQERLARSLIEGFVTDDDGTHAAEVMESGRRMTQVIIHEPAFWLVGGDDRPDPADPPRYVLRMYVPGSWRKDLAKEAVPALTAVLAEAEREAGRDPERLLREPHAWVHVLGVSEGSYGLYGRPMDAIGLIDALTRPHREAIARASDRELPEGVVIDPVCGMTVDLSQTDLMLEHEGRVVGFCGGPCRRVYMDEHALHTL